MLEDFLPLVTKPARYINAEINAVHKDLTNVRTRVCLFFPDVYEVGMSHLGLRILYHIVNSRDDTACERVFSPWTDYEERLRAQGRLLTSLESNVPLRQFDIIGITLQYELSYTNVLNGLTLAGIPLRTKDRRNGDPLIVAGGPCAVNPEPLADFIDVFFIGEAEEAVHEIIDLKQEHPDRYRFFKAISQRPGFYVPALGKLPVRRRYIRDLESAPYPDKPILPLMKPIHDRVTVEVARGCIRGCRFCQAGIIYRPYRERSTDRVRDILHESLLCTGYEELSLASLSSGDYSDIQPLVVELMNTYRDSRVSVSLPSLRVGTLTPDMIEAIAGTRKTGFTLAPEAGTDRLRRVINKPVSSADLMEAAETIFRNGWSVLKLYFMIGLPTETDEDLDGIIKLAHDLLALGKRVSKRHIQLNVSVSTFVPKPHTPFQWLGQAGREDIRKKQAYLERGLARRGISLRLHDPETSLLESAFARGDRELGKVLEEAVRLGCRFDGWTERFDFEKWITAFQHCGSDLPSYAGRTFALDDDLPWDHIRTGVTTEFLKREYQRALTEEITGNCRMVCEKCGIGCPDGASPALGKPAAPETTSAGTERLRSQTGDQRTLSPEVTTRVRMKFTKTGRVRFLSHLDFMTLVHRAVVRAEIPISFSLGFNPHPRIAFGPALSVGMESESEYLDMETDPRIDLLSAVKRLNTSLPEGVRIIESRVIPKKAPSLSGSIRRYTYAVNIVGYSAAGIEKKIDSFLSRTSVIVSRQGKQQDIRQGIESISWTRDEGSCTLHITLQDHEQQKPRVQDVIEQLMGVDKEEAAFFRITRLGMFVPEKDLWKDPMDV
jgi:radical SAM-linked protein